MILINTHRAKGEVRHEDKEDQEAEKEDDQIDNSKSLLHATGKGRSPLGAW